MIVVENAYRAQLLRFMKEFPECTFIFHKQAHFKSLVIRSVFLRTDIGDIQIETMDQLQNFRYASGNVPQHEFQENNAVFASVCLQVSDFLQLTVRLRQLRLVAIRIDKQCM